MSIKTTLMKLMLTFLFSILFFNVFAQTNIIEGKIYTNDNKVVNAYIHLTAYEGTPQEFQYSLDKNSELKTGDFSNVSKVELNNGVVYETYFINVPVISGDYMSRTKFDYEYLSNYFKGVAFVEKILTGKVALFQFIDKYQHEHFFYKQSSDTTLEYLRNNTFVNEKGQIEYDNAYKNMISYLLLQSCQNNTKDDDLNQLNYNVRPIIKAFKQINKCMGSEVSTEQFEQNKKSKLDFGLMGGYLSTGVGTDGYHRSTQPMFGVYLDITPGKVYKNYRLSFEATYQTYKSNSDSVIYAMSHYANTLEISAINIASTIRFLLNKTPNSLFLEGGINLDYFSKIKETTQIKDVLFNYVKTYEASKSGVLAYGLIGGAGYDFRRVSLHLRSSLVFTSDTFKGLNYFGVVAKIKLTDWK